jgi:hypothetical protein
MNNLKSGYFTSTMKVKNGVISWVDDGVDLSHTSQGVNAEYKGYSVSTYFHMTAKELAMANFVNPTIPFYVTCFEKLSNTLKDVGLD